VRLAEELEIVEKKLAQTGTDRYCKEARREVAKFDRTRTLFGG
jgi:hypothetical protein